LNGDGSPRPLHASVRMPTSNVDNASSRKALNTSDRNNIAIVHRAPISDSYRWSILRYGCLRIGKLKCLPYVVFDPLRVCCWSKLKESSYVQIHENRVETNYASFRCPCLWCCVDDDIEVYYFDYKKTTYADRAACCAPACTHNLCVPTCCDACGEAVVLNGQPCCCARPYEMLPGLKDADAFVEAYRAARERWHAGQPPPAVEMVKYETTTAAPVQVTSYRSSTQGSSFREAPAEPNPLFVAPAAVPGTSALRSSMTTPSRLAVPPPMAPRAPY